MKPLTSLTVFDNDHLPLITDEHGKHREYYLRNNRDVKVVALPYLPNELLCATMLFEMHSLHGTHFRRIDSRIFSIEYVREGRLYVRQNSRGYLLEPGDLFLMLPENRNEYLVGRGDYCVKSSIAISGLLLSSFLETSGLISKSVLEKVDATRMVELLAQFKELGSAEGAGGALENSRLTYQLLHFLCHPERVSVASDRILVVLEYMKQNFCRPLNIAQLSKIFGYSSPHLMRSFRNAYGISPYQMLMRLRMKHASSLLLDEPGLSIKEIAIRVGYARPLNFSSEFRRRYGMSPLQYRRYYSLNSIID